MKPQQIMELLQAMREDRKADQAEANTRHEEMKAKQAKTDAGQVQLQEEIRAKMKNAIEEKVNAAMQWQEKTDTSHKETVAKIKLERDMKMTVC